MGVGEKKHALTTESKFEALYSSKHGMAWARNPEPGSVSLCTSELMPYSTRPRQILLVVRAREAWTPDFQHFVRTRLPEDRCKELGIAGGRWGHTQFLRCAPEFVALATQYGLERTGSCLRLVDIPPFYEFRIVTNASSGLESVEMEFPWQELAIAFCTGDKHGSRVFEAVMQGRIVLRGRFSPMIRT